MRVTFTDGRDANISADTPAERAALLQFAVDVGSGALSCVVKSAPQDGGMTLTVTREEKPVAATLVAEKPAARAEPPEEKPTARHAEPHKPAAHHAHAPANGHKKH